LKNWGFQTRILLLSLAPAIIVAGALSVYFVLALLEDIDKDLIDKGLGLSRQLAAIAEYSAFSGDRQTLNGIALAALEESHVSRVEVYDQEGEVLAASGALPPPLSPLPQIKQAQVLHEDEEHVRIAAPVLRHRFDSPDPFLSESTPPALPENPPLLGWVVVEMSRHSLDTRRKETIVFTLALVLVTVAGTSLLGMVLVRQVTRPVVRLERAVERIRAGQLNLQLPADSGGELQRLEEGFNSMARGLQDARSNLEEKIRDATRELERKRAEAERSSLAKSRFLAAASHDLRQPLHALNLFAADLSNRASDAEQQKLASQIATSIRSMSELLDTLLNISRLDVAGITAQISAVPLQTVFDKLRDNFSREAETRGLRLRFHPTPAWVETDPALLERLLANLITNALRYTERGSVLVCARRRRKGWRLEVRDSGSGIAPEHQQAVFEEFFQVGNTEREQGKGLGLGLAIVDRLAKALGVNIGLKSQLGSGSVFALHLNAATPAEIAAAPSTAAPIIGIPTFGNGFMEATASQIGGWLQDWGFCCQRLSNQDEMERVLAGDGSEEYPGAPRIWLAVGNAAGLAPLGDRQAMAILITPDQTPEAEERGWYVLPHPARPAKLRALLQRLLGDAANH